MPIMTWDQSLDVGVESMNREHREILDVMNQIYDARARGLDGPLITLLVTQLGDVCKRHFADEEQLMAKANFPELATHKILHEKLLARFTQHAGEIKTSGGKVSEDFFNFLRFWLSSHIKGVDIKYGKHVREKHAA